MELELENALRYISEKLLENPETELSPLIEDASRRFDLSPLETEFLINKYIFGEE